MFILILSQRKCSGKYEDVDKHAKEPTIPLKKGAAYNLQKFRSIASKSRCFQITTTVEEYKAI